MIYVYRHQNWWRWSTACDWYSDLATAYCSRSRDVSKSIASLSYLAHLCKTSDRSRSYLLFACSTNDTSSNRGFKSCIAMIPYVFAVALCFSVARFIVSGTQQMRKILDFSRPDASWYGRLTTTHLGYWSGKRSTSVLKGAYKLHFYNLSRFIILLILIWLYNYITLSYIIIYCCHEMPSSLYYLRITWLAVFQNKMRTIKVVFSGEFQAHMVPHWVSTPFKLWIGFTDQVVLFLMFQHVVVIWLIFVCYFVVLWVVWYFVVCLQLWPFVDDNHFK